jgi:hypothetical protein
MNRYRVNSDTLYLRPIENQPNYQIQNAARWLVAKGEKPTYKQALHYVIYLESTYPWKFKTLMASFYDKFDHTIKRMKYKDVNTYKSTDSNFYGDEWHMWF